MKIWCKRCSKDMGNIIKSKMRKGWVCLCDDCYFKMKVADDAMKAKGNPTERGADFLRMMGLG